LSLNTSTGVISGTPTQAGLVVVQLPGYTPVQVLGIITIFP